MASLELANITKSFNGVRALDDAWLKVRDGTVHALLGENGAGKTTLMRIAFGMLSPDAGHVRIDGIDRSHRSPADAIAAGVGMIHQHFALVPAMTVAENIALGMSGLYDHRAARARVERLCSDTGLPVDPGVPVASLGVAGQQRVEILKALARDARLLILDEPTAVLPPTEARSLLDWVRSFATGDRSAVLITHKVREALSIADDVTVLRRGRTVLAVAASQMSEERLAQAMVQQMPANPVRRESLSRLETIISLDDVSVSLGSRTSLKPTSLVVRRHEIVGVAGVEGSGYRELLRVIAGRLSPTTGRRRSSGAIGFVPEDRHREALAIDLTATENVAMRGLGRRRGVIDWTSMRAATALLAAVHDVRGPLDSAVRSLSGGNQQKLVLARELGDNPEVVVAENPTRGLDVLATAAIHDRLIAARARGAAVVLYSTDLEELLMLADRIVVMHSGSAMEVPLDIESVTRALVGLPI